MNEIEELRAINFQSIKTYFENIEFDQGVAFINVLEMLINDNDDNTLKDQDIISEQILILYKIYILLIADQKHFKGNLTSQIDIIEETLRLLNKLLNNDAQENIAKQLTYIAESLSAAV